MADFQPKDAAGYGAFVEAAYAAYAKNNGDLKPDISLPQGWRNAAWVTMRDFPPIGASVERFYGFIAMQEDGPGVVLALRGTVGWMEWYDDFVVTFQPFKSGATPYGRVSTGFARIYSTLRVYDVAAPGAPVHAGEAYIIDASEPKTGPVPSFSAAVADVVTRNRPAAATEAAAPTIVVGHSLGSALVTLYALENAVEQHLGAAVVYTFASPRVGDHDFVAAYNKWVPVTWRIVNNADVVPNAPFDVMGYAHVDRLELLDSTGKAKSSPGCAHAMSSYRHLLDGVTPLGDCAASQADEALVLMTPSSTPVTTDPRIGLHTPASTVPLSYLTPADVATARAKVVAAPPEGALTSGRIAALAAADARPTPLDYERIMHAQNDLLDINWFERGLVAGKSVCRIILRDAAQREVGYGTGFLVAPGVILTNHHVLSDATEASTALAEFDYEFDVAGNPKPTARFALEPERFFFTSPQDVLDCSFVAVAPTDTNSGRRSSEFDWLRLNPQVGKITVGEMVTIIQHPSGQPKEIAARENQLLQIADTTLLYATDTAPGSSGSPVFNDSWQVVALHHSGIPATDAQGNWLGPDGNPAPPNPSDAQVKWLGNEGIRISQIVASLRVQPAHPVRDAILAVAEGQPIAPAPLSATITAHSPRNEASTRAIAPWQPSSSPSQDSPEAADDAIVMTQIGGRIVVSAPSTSVMKMTFHARESIDAPASKPTEGASEKFILDPAYGKRKGYDPDFLAPNGSLPLPTLKTSARSTPLTNGVGDVLDYYHYSLTMNAARELLYWAASNSDRSETGTKGRKTLAGGAADAWVYDPRIGKGAQIGDAFYRGSGFDHGHVVRREDNYWGATDTEATYANFDSFHFTNCTPQHPAFNRSQQAGLWGELENRIASESKSKQPKLSLFAGPVFSERDPLRNGVLVPTSFWKVVLAPLDAGGLGAFAFLLSQEPLVDKKEADINLDPFQTYQLSTHKLESMLDMVFPDAVHAADQAHDAGKAEAAQTLRPLKGISDFAVPPVR